MNSDKVYLLLDDPDLDSGAKWHSHEEWIPAFMDYYCLDSKEVVSRIKAIDQGIKISSNQLSQIKNGFARISVQMIVPLIKALTGNEEDADLFIRQALSQLLPKTVQPYLSAESMRSSDILKRLRAQRGSLEQLAFETNEGNFLKVVIQKCGKYQCLGECEYQNLRNTVNHIINKGQVRAISKKGKSTQYRINSKGIKNLVLLLNNKIVERYYDTT